MGTPSYEGKQVYMGLDVHREFFVASCICDGVVVKRCRMPGTAEAVISLVSKEFGGASVRAAYEAGYSGFWLYRKLAAAGIDCIVVHAASIEVSSRDTVKTDKRDSLKIAQQLAAGRLRGVRVPTEEAEQRRLLTRTREQLMNKKRRVMVQIRMRLHYFGRFPESIQRRIKLQDVEDILVGLEGGGSAPLGCCVTSGLSSQRWCTIKTKCRDNRANQRVCTAFYYGTIVNETCGTDVTTVLNKIGSRSRRKPMFQEFTITCPSGWAAYALWQGFIVVK